MNSHRTFQDKDATLQTGRTKPDAVNSLVEFPSAHKINRIKHELQNFPLVPKTVFVLFTLPVILGTFPFLRSDPWVPGVHTPGAPRFDDCQVNLSLRKVFQMTHHLDSSTRPTPPRIILSSKTISVVYLRIVQGGCPYRTHENPSHRSPQVPLYTTSPR